MLNQSVVQRSYGASRKSGMNALEVKRAEGMFKQGYDCEQIAAKIRVLPEVVAKFIEFWKNKKGYVAEYGSDEDKYKYGLVDRSLKEEGAYDYTPKAQEQTEVPAPAPAKEAVEEQPVSKEVADPELTPAQKAALTKAAKPKPAKKE